MAVEGDAGFSFSRFRAKFDIYLALHPDFEKCTSVEEKIKYLLKNDSLREDVPEDIKHKKCLKQSQSFKEDGNSYFGKKDYKNALECYTKCIYYAPVDDGNILSVAYANRSAVLYEMTNYSESLEDIHRSFESGYPENLKYKIYLRKGLCLQKLSQNKTAKQNFELVQKYLEKAANLNEERKNQIETQIQANLDSINDDDDDDDDDEDDVESVDQSENSNNSPSPELFNGKNPNLEAASSSIQIAMSDSQGRFLAATEDIPSGNTLLIEKPFASALLAEHYLTHCFNCYRRVIAPIACSNCAQIGFCSEKCRDESWSAYHRFECCKLSHLNEIGILYLSLRVLLTADLKEVMNAQEQFPVAQNECLGVDESGKYDGHSYYTIFNLQTHLDDLSTVECDNFIFYSCHVLWFLEDQIRSNSMEFPIALNEDTKYFTAYLLFRQSLQIICNAYAITETTGDEDPSDVYSQEQTRIGVALYPIASLMNHSCKPNIISSFVGDELIVRCVKELKKGDTVLNCYGPHYKRMNREERQSSLMKQYKFDCCCEACETENEELDSFKCSNCDGRLQFKLEDKSSTVGCCIDCAKTEDCQNKMEKCLEANRLYKDALKLMELSDYANALEKLENCLALRESCLYRRNTEIGVVQDQLAKCLSLSGDFVRALTFLRLSLESVKNVHGSDSVEYGLELGKMTDIQIRIIMDTQVEEIQHKKFRLQLEDFLNTCEEGMEILSKSFGEWHPFVKDLKDKREHFSQLFQI